MKWSNHFNQLKVVDFEKNGFGFQQRHPNYSLNIVLRGLKKDQWKTVFYQLKHGFSSPVFFFLQRDQKS